MDSILYGLGWVEVASCIAGFLKKNSLVIAQPPSVGPEQECWRAAQLRWRSRGFYFLYFPYFPYFPCNESRFIVKDPLYNSGAAVAVGSGWAARRLFEANSWAIGEKSNAAERPSPADHRPQGVMQRVLNADLTTLWNFCGFSGSNNLAQPCSNDFFADNGSPIDWPYILNLEIRYKLD